MIVKCIINEKNNLDSIFSNYQDIVDEDSYFKLELNKYYLVYAMTLRKGYIWYYICKDDFCYPIWYSSILFEVVNSQLSKYWIYSFIRIKRFTELIGTYTTWAYPEWANDPYNYYDRLTDGEDQEVNTYKKYKSLMDVEFPNPGIQDKAVAMDENWLFCSYCIDAWQSFSQDGMVICPACQRMMHNPNYVNPLKILNF